MPDGSTTLRTTPNSCPHAKEDGDVQLSPPAAPLRDDHKITQSLSVSKTALSTDKNPTVLMRRLRLVVVPSTLLATTALLAPGRGAGATGFALESAAARVCREAGGRVTTNVMVRDLDLPVLDATDSRQLEVVVDGLPLFDTTLVQ